MPSEKLLKMLGVTAELTGTTMSQGAIEVMLHDLSEYPEEAVLKALNKCRKEIKGRLFISEIISRIDDGRPGVEEAWALIPKSEEETAVVTAEMVTAHSAVGSLFQTDMIAARMAFKEAYKAAVVEARAAGKPTKWTASLGWDASRREGPLIRAYEQGKLSADDVNHYLPNSPIQENKRLEAPRDNENLKKVQALIESTGLTKK
jgi:hypothetical protein